MDVTGFNMRELRHNLWLFMQKEVRYVAEVRAALVRCAIGLEFILERRVIGVEVETYSPNAV